MSEDKKAAKKQPKELKILDKKTLADGTELRQVEGYGGEPIWLDPANSVVAAPVEGGKNAKEVKEAAPADAKPSTKTKGSEPVVVAAPEAKTETKA